MGANALFGRYADGEGSAVIDALRLLGWKCSQCCFSSIRVVVKEASVCIFAEKTSQWWWCRKPHYAGVLSLKAIVG